MLFDAVRVSDRASYCLRIVALLALLLSNITPALASSPAATGTYALDARGAALSPPAQVAPAVAATKTDRLLIDRDGDGKADPGDTLRYTVVVSNTGSADAGGVIFNDTLDRNVTLAPGSIQTTPLALNQAATTPEDTLRTLTLGGSDADGDLLTYTIVTPPAYGSLSGTGAARTYTPANNYNGADSLTFRVCDTSAPAACDTATVALTISSVNDAPAAAGNSYTLAEDTTLNSGSVLTNDADTHSGAPGENNTPLTAQLATGPVHTKGFTLNPNGTFVYTPTANFFGADNFTYRAVDALGGLSAPATVTLSVTNVNDNPDAVDDAATVGEDSVANPIPVLANDTSAPDTGETLTISAVGQPGNGSTAVTGGGTGLTYTPNPSFVGTDVFTYTIGDGNGGSDTAAVTVTVTTVNDAPSFTKGADQTVLEDAGPQTVAGWATTILPGPPDEIGQTLTFTVTANSNPALFSAAPAIAPNGTLTYTPAPNAFGTATLTVTLQDDGGTAAGGVDTSAPQSFTITVTPANDAPDAVDDSYTVLEDSGLTVLDVRANDTSAPDTGETLSISFPPNVPAGPGDETNNGTVVFYTTFPNLNGSDTFQYISDDGNGGQDTATVTVTVTPVNDAPAFTKGPDQTVLEDAGPQTVNPWATGISAGPGDELGQTLAFTVTGNTNPGLFSALPAISSGGDLTYTPAANLNGTATITITLQDNGGTANGGVDTSAPQSFTITVTPVNDPPSFTTGPDLSLPEDSGPQTIDPWAFGLAAGPPDEAGQTLAFSVTGNSNPGLFAASPAISPAGVLTFTPATNINGTATITLSLQDDGGTANGGIDTSAPQSFTITVGGVNDAPSFVAGPDQTVLEDSGPQTVNPWATSISAGPGESGQTVSFTVTGNSNPGLFSAGPAVSPAGVLTFIPAANLNGTATITITLQDNGGTAGGGVDTSPSQTFDITVTPVNDAPAFTKGADQSVLENVGPQTVNPWATGISAGPADESGQTLTFNITGNSNPGLFSAGPAVSPAGVLTFTSATNTFGTATITIVVQDNGGTANGGVNTSAAQTFTITVTDVNSAPSFTKGADQTVLEDSGAQTVNSWATGISAGPGEGGQTLTFNVTGNDNPGLFSAGPAISPAGVLTFTPAANTNGTATITIVLQDNGGTANGGVDTSAPQSFIITVTAVNDAPAFTKGADQTVLEDSGAQTVTGWATAISAGPADESGQTVSFEITGNTNPTLFSAGPAVASNGTLTFTPAANAFGTATISIRARDNGGTANGGLDATATQTFVINVTGVNDAPSFTKGADVTVDEDAGAQTINPWATGISAGPGEAGQTLTFNVTGNTNPTLFSAGPAVASNGTLTFTSAPNAFGTATITLVLQDNGGTASGGVDTSAAQTFVITVNPVNDPPTLGDSTLDYTVLGNTQLRVGETTPGASVLHLRDNQDVLEKSTPSDIDGPGPLAVVPFSGTTGNGDLILNADGTFTYEPNPGFEGADVITFQVSDNGSPAGIATGTLTITVSQMVWYVRDVVDANNPAAGDTGRSTNAFEVLADAGTAATDNDYIFVFRGNTGTTPLNSGIVIDNTGVKLHGEGVGLTVPGFGTLIPAGSQPRITNTAAGGNGVSVSTASSLAGVEIRGLDIAGTANAIDLTASGANNAGVTISNNTISAAGVEGIDVNANSTGSVTLSINDNTLTATGNAIDIARTAGTLTITTFDDNTISGNTGGAGIVVTGPAIFDATPGNPFNTVSGGTTVIGASGNGVGGAGMVLTSVTGDLSFTDLDIFADNGAGLQVGSSGTFNATGGTGFRIAIGAGVAIIEATGGPAVSITAATIDLQLTSLRSTNSASTGVSLDTVAGTFSAGSGSSISNATGTDFNINAGAANVTYNGTITDDVGQLVAVTNTTGGTKSFTGAITDGNDGDGSGISLTSNTGATISFSGGVVLSTGGNAAFAATGGGTVSVTGSANTLATTTGTTLNVANTTIGASALTFRSISSNGATNGIVLNNTGNSGLTVTGNTAGNCGGNVTTSGATVTAPVTADCSGGTILNSTGTGVLLTSASNISLTRVRIAGSADDGIGGTTVSGLTLTSSLIESNGNAVGDRGIDVTNLTGSGGIATSTIRSSKEHNIVIANTTGNLTAFNVTNSQIATNDLTPATGTGDDGIQILNNGTGSMAISVTQSAFTDNKGDHFQAASSASATGSITAVFSNNTLITTAANDPQVVGGGITINPGNAADITFTISNNNIQQAFDDSININHDPSSTAASNLEGTISGNTIGTAGDLGSGSESSNAITLGLKGAGTNTIAVTNNTIREWGNQYCIFVGISEGSASANTTVTNNNCAATFPNALLINGIHVAAGATAGPPVDNGTLCVTLTGNNVTGAGNAANGDADIRLRQRFSTTIKLPGYGGANNDTAAVNAFVAGNNDPNGGAPPAAPTVSSVQNVGGGGGGFVGGAACALPPLLAAGGEGSGAPSITQADLASVSTEALARWRASGISVSDQAKLEAVSFRLADLEPGHLGAASATTVLIDRDAAGWGWYVDPMPADDREFAAAGGDLRTATDGPADGRMDLLTVVMHELGHMIGREDLPIAGHPHELMAEALPTGVRRLPDGAGARTAPQQAGSFPLNIGTLPAGKRVTITFDVVIASPLPAGVTQLSNQGRVTGGNFAALLTNDPSTAAPNDPTITPLDIAATAFRAYLPIVANPVAVTLTPDLVVTGISLVPNKSAFAAGEPVEVRVTVKNQGSAAAAPFWVDLYINPSSPPSAANQIWNTRCGMTPCFGLVWQVPSGLAPGQSITLSSQSLPPGYSIWPGWFAAGTSDLYAYADSYNPGVVAGAVAESDEANNRAELRGLSVAGTNPVLVGVQSIEDLSSRPVTPRE